MVLVAAVAALAAVAVVVEAVGRPRPKGVGPACWFVFWVRGADLADGSAASPVEGVQRNVPEGLAGFFWISPPPHYSLIQGPSKGAPRLA